MQLKSKRKKKGFTLIELLVVIMLIGIVLGISIPAVVNLQKSQNARKFEYFTTVVKEATDLYVEQYGKSFDETENCFDIVYDSLVEENLIQESDITCLSSEGQQGIIQATRIPGTNNFTYEYFLTCKDQSTGEIFHESGIAPTGCKGVNGNFVVNIDSAVKVVDGVASDYTFDTWTRGKVIVTVSSVNPYFYEIDHYEYSLDGSSYVRMTGNQVTFEASMNKKVYFRAVDTNGNYSGDTVAVIKIDNDKPTATLTLNGTKGNNDWYVSDVTGTCTNQSDGSGSGVSSCTVNPESYTASNSSATFTLTIQDYAGNTNTTSQTIKIDKDKPVMDRVDLTKNSGGSYSSGSTSDVPVTITAVGHDNVGIAKYIYSHDLNSWSDLTNPWLINWDGSWHFYIKAVDAAGNISDNYMEFDLIISQIPIGRSWEYGYTGNVQTFSVPYTAEYKIEVWGAQGGWDTYEGGLGGYASGTIRLNAGQQLYVYVGGSGKVSLYGGNGWNGGGIGRGVTEPPDRKNGQSGGGGGGTDIRMNGQEIANRIIVAGGGGGGSNSTGGGPGGASGNGNGQLFQGSTGGNPSTYEYRDGGGGGGGYYGGNGGQDRKGCYYPNESQTCQGGYASTGGTSYVGSQFSNPVMTPGLRGGDGYAKFTIVGR